MAAERKGVLVSLLGRTRPLELPNDQTAIKECVKQRFNDVLQPGRDFFLQMKDPSWGEFVDLERGQEIPDRATFRAVLMEPVRY